METVQLQCGSCNKLMAISIQHLGGQVRCPHCQAVVQTPPRQQPAVAPMQAATEILPPPVVETREVESIFSPPEPSDDLFDAGPQRPLVEMPVEPRPAPPPQDAVTVDARPSLFPETTEAIAPGPPEVPAEEDAAELRSFQRPRPPVDKGYISLMLLIFLVPYSIMMTLFVIYLWYQAANPPHPFEEMPDPVPKKDGPKEVRRPKHDQPLGAYLKVPLGKSIRIGDIEVKPIKVARDPLGDLALSLEAKNVSRNLAFSPAHPDYFKINKSRMPYTFLESKRFVRLYGGHLAFQRGGGGDDLTEDGLLKPGQTEEVRITTRDNKPVVAEIVKSNDEVFTWRVQLRRGLVGRESRTAVIGVQFSGSDIK